MVGAAEARVRPCEDHDEECHEDPRAEHVGEDVAVGVVVFAEQQRRFDSVHEVPDYGGDTAARVHAAVMEDFGEALADAQWPGVRRRGDDFVEEVEEVFLPEEDGGEEIGGGGRAERALGGAAVRGAGDEGDEDGEVDGED